MLKTDPVLITIAIANMDCQLAKKKSTPALGKSILHWYRYLLSGLLVTSSCVAQGATALPSWSQSVSTGDYCQISSSEVSAKNVLRRAAQTGNPQSQSRYAEMLKKHASSVQSCRQKSWLKNQAIWIRLYPCDVRPGYLEEIFDRMVNKGYNQVYVATFYGKVLLPRSSNNTVWTSILNTRTQEKTDLLADAIKKGHARGLKVYSWMYTLNFGPEYAFAPEGQSALGVNGRGETTLFAGEEGLQRASDADTGSVLFVDPYSQRARNDYERMVREVIRRRPDGVLFDYVRFPRGQGERSFAGNVKDLWIYNEESRQVLLSKAQNAKGTALIERYLDRGGITTVDLKELDALYPNEVSPLWQGRTPLENEGTMPPDEKLPWIEWDLWQLTVAHASDGVVDFLSRAAAPVTQQQIRSGSVFFPEANRPVGRRAYDSRLQPWDRFVTNEWHPMAYATCNKTDCIVSQIQRVVSFATPNTDVVPALAGNWGTAIDGRPSLEEQMRGIRQNIPQIHSISHFSFSWQEPEFDAYRSTCRLN